MIRIEVWDHQECFDPEEGVDYCRPDKLYLFPDNIDEYYHKASDLHKFNQFSDHGLRPQTVGVIEGPSRGVGFSCMHEDKSACSLDSMCVNHTCNKKYIDKSIKSIREVIKRHDLKAVGVSRSMLARVTDEVTSDYIWNEIQKLREVK